MCGERKSCVWESQSISSRYRRTELSPDIAEGLYVDESGFLIHPHLLLPDEPRKSHEERWGTRRCRHHRVTAPRP